LECKNQRKGCRAKLVVQIKNTDKLSPDFFSLSNYEVVHGKHEHDETCSKEYEDPWKMWADTMQRRNATQINSLSKATLRKQLQRVVPQSIHCHLFGTLAAKKMHARANDYATKTLGEARKTSIDPRYWFLNFRQFYCDPELSRKVQNFKILFF